MNELDHASTPTIASSLSTIVDRYGPAALHKPEDVRLLLRQDCPDSDREIDLVLKALREGVPQRLLAAHGSVELRDALLQSVDRLKSTEPFDAATAMWAVRTWAVALALPVTSIDAPRADPRADRTLVASLASVITPLAGARVERPPTPIVPSPPPVIASPVPAPVVPTIAPPVVPPIAPPPKLAEPALPRSADVRAAEPIAAQPAPSKRKPLLWKAAIAAAVVLLVALGWIAWRSIAVPPGNPPVVAATAVPAPASAVSSPPVAPVIEAPKATPSPPPPMPETRVAPPPTTTRTPVEAPPVAAAAPPPVPIAKAIVSEAPTIARIDVPTIAAGKPFQVAVSIAGGADRVASVERRTGPNEGRIPPFVANAVSTLSRTQSGALVVPFKAIATPGSVVVDFNLVDRSGVRGASRKVELHIVGNAVASMLATPTPTPPSPPPPPPGTIAQNACTRATCGSVVSMRPLDAAGEVELIVRMDDRSIQTIRLSGRWRVGSRIQRIGERYVPLAE